MYCQFYGISRGAVSYYSEKAKSFGPRRRFGEVEKHSLLGL